MRNPIHPKIDDNIPDFIKEEYPVFHKLIIDYFKWLETDENFLYVLINFADDVEINNQIKPYIDILKSELGWAYKAKLQVDDRTLIKFLRDFYLSRGTEQSFKVLFKLLFNVPVEIKYPRDQLFKLSDNSYVIEHEIVTTANNFKNDTELLAKFLNTDILNISITGLESGLTLIVDKISPFIKDNTTYLKILVSRTNNDFKPFENVVIYSSEIGSYVETIFGKITPHITYPGYNYRVGEKLIINNNNNCEFIAGDISVKSILSGGITDIGIQKINGQYATGSLYKTGDKVIITDPHGTGFSGEIITAPLRQAEIYLSVIDGEIVTPTISEAGLGYKSKPKITVVDTRIPPLGTGAYFTCDDIITNDYIGNCNIVYAGTNYTDNEAEFVTISAPPAGGTQATATAQIVGGKVIKITITDRGSGYTIAPTVQVIQGLHTPALITAELMGSITTISKIDGGQNYHENYTRIIFDLPDSNESWATVPVIDPITYIDGKILPILSNPGYGYYTIPSYTLAGNLGGNGFSIDLVLNNTEIAINDYTPGQNYTSGVSMSIDLPEYTGKIEYVHVINPGRNFINFDNTVITIETDGGKDGVLYPHSKNIGKINRFYEKESYWVYKCNNLKNEFIFDCDIKIPSEETAKIYASVDSCINRNKQRFKNNIGFLESNAYLHDSYYYQQFSYLVSSEYPSKFSKEIVDELLHPVGFLKFNRFTSENFHTLSPMSVMDIELIKIIDLNLNIDFEASFDPFFSIVYFTPPGMEDETFEFPGEYVVFSINNILDTLYKPNNTTNLRLYDEQFSLGLDHFGYHKIQDFDTNYPDIIELAALDTEIEIVP